VFSALAFEDHNFFSIFSGNGRELAQSEDISDFGGELKGPIVSLDFLYATSEEYSSPFSSLFIYTF